MSTANQTITATSVAGQRRRRRLAARGRKFWDATGKRLPIAIFGYRFQHCSAVSPLWGMGHHHRADAQPGLPFTQAELFTLTAIAGISGCDDAIPASFLIRLSAAATRLR